MVTHAPSTLFMSVLYENVMTVVTCINNLRLYFGDSYVEQSIMLYILILEPTGN
jgi:hypothetical protein